jgi:CDP-diacylglycerol--serine O-phosphatidyltransferase
VLLLTVGLVAFMTTEPWATLLAVEALYIASIPLSIRSYRRLRRAAEALRSGVPHEEIEAADHPGL